MLSASLAGGGAVALQGEAGPINPADAADIPITATLKITNWNLAASAAIPASSGIDGVIALEGSATSNGRTIAITGHLKAEKLRLTAAGAATRDPLLMDVALSDDLRDHSLQISRGELAFAGAKASLTGTLMETGDTPVLNMALSTPAAPAAALARLMPPLGVVLPSGSALEGGTATARLALTGPVDLSTVSGAVAVHNTRLTNFDIGTKMSVIEKLAGIKTGPHTEIQTFSANVLVNPEGTTVRDIRLVLPAVGELTGGGTISPTHALAFRMKAAMRRGAIISALAPSNVFFSVAGTSSDPQFRPDMGQLATEEVSWGLQGVKAGGLDSAKVANTVVKGLFGVKKQQ